MYYYYTGEVICCKTNSLDPGVWINNADEAITALDVADEEESAMQLQIQEAANAAARRAASTSQPPPDAVQLSTRTQAELGTAKDAKMTQTLFDVLVHSYFLTNKSFIHYEEISTVISY